MSTVMIVGATRGTGLEMVKQYAADGDTVIACARDTGAASLLDEVAATEKNVGIEQLDVADPASIDAAAERIGDGAIDSVIVVAGVTGGKRQSLDDLDVDAWHETLNANTIGPVLVAKAFKRNLVASGNGNLMILSSQVGASVWPLGGHYIYSTTKAALNRLVECWQSEEHAVSFTRVSLGDTLATDFASEWDPDQMMPFVKEWNTKGYLAGRYMTPGDVAMHLVGLLDGPENVPISYITPRFPVP